MNTRTIVALCVVVALVGGGGAWWALRGDDLATTGAEEPTPTPTTDPSARTPTATATPEPEGEPIASCAPEEPLSANVPKTYWGMHVVSPIGAEFPDAPIGAVNLTTSQTYWNQVETAPGSYDFSRLDAIVATSQEQDARPMLVMGFTPSFHAKQPASPTARATMPDEAAWRAWVTAVVERYGARLDYQVWPEPNITGNWEGTPEQMARLSVIAAEIIHDRAPDAVVVAPATALRLKGQQRWVDRFWGASIDGVRPGDVLDAVALDPFPLEKGTPEDSVDLLCRAQEILADNGVDLPLWTNEINYGVPSGGTSTVKPYSDVLQAAVVARTYVLHAALGVDRVYWLGWFSYHALAVQMEREGATTPAGHAYSVVHDWLAGGRLPHCRVEDGVHTCVVDRRDQELRIHWRVRGTSTVVAGEGAQHVETLSGERRRVEVGDPIRIGQSPVAVFAEG